ncbi:hypothetical protein RF55_3562 [Lasius niger]|uniref:Uncharacterized protein n=1 Tax=Lasius niger TaxID=67767 RepID=A0A0J7L0Q4_LASNI|nr:hypothetical protein RF55_3562 [Lasius niger]
MYRITGTRFYSEHGRIVGMAAAIAIVAVSRAEKKRKKKEKKKNIGMERAMEIQDRRITNACRPSFVAGALTANSKLR